MATKPIFIAASRAIGPYFRPFRSKGVLADARIISLPSRGFCGMLPPLKISWEKGKVVRVFDHQ